MARDYLNQPPNALRRDDRGVDDEAWIVNFLQNAAVGTLALSHEGQPFVNTNLFVYDADVHCIYTHTARVGRTRAVVEANPKACFSVMEMGRMLPAPEALEFSVEYAGVTCFGEVSIVEDGQAATDALQRLLDKYAPHLHPDDDYRPPVPQELVRTSVFRLDITSWSGKKKEVAADFPGAFWYSEQPVLASAAAQPTED